MQRSIHRNSNFEYCLSMAENKSNEAIPDLLADNEVHSTTAPATDDAPDKTIAQGKQSERKRIAMSADTHDPPKRGKFETNKLSLPGQSKLSGTGTPPAKEVTKNGDAGRNRYDNITNKAKEIHRNCCKLNKQMKELVKANVELASMLVTLLESVDVPGSPKLVGSVMHLGEGVTKKAILDRINILLERAGITQFPGALGEILYNDLFMELRNYKSHETARNRRTDARR